MALDAPSQYENATTLTIPPALVSRQPKQPPSPMNHQSPISGAHPENPAPF